MLPPHAAFVCSLLFFHVSEFLLTAKYNRTSLSRRSWLVSWPYCAAMLLASLEYALELRLCPQIKLPAVSALGLAMVVGGETLRKAGMMTAAQNFTHQVQLAQREGHSLVTHGVYRYIRHPGYAGWMLWAVGTQVLLVNPACTVVFTIVTWHFFRRRIQVEEHFLRRFFGLEFDSYKGRTPSGIPGI